MELEAEIRLTVDELMREELKNLKLVSVLDVMCYLRFTSIRLLV